MTAELASALIRLRFPELDPEDLRYLGSGWEFDAFLTRDGWVFRFPRRKDSAQLFTPERIAHDLVATVLPRGIAIPRVVIQGEPALGFPYSFAGHRFIEGVTADRFPPELLPVLARDLAAVLGALHSIPAELAQDAGVRQVDADEAGRGEWLESGFQAAFQLRGIDPWVDQALNWLAHVPLPVPVPAAPHNLIHQDLGPEHLIVDPLTGRLVGVLDWTDAIVGDPARDFVFLVTWRGWRFAREVLQRYSPRVDEGFSERLLFMSRLLSMMWLATAYRAGVDLSGYVKGVRNVFDPES